MPETAQAAYECILGPLLLTVAEYTKLERYWRALKQQLTDSEDARRIEKENAQWELQAKNEKVTALEAEVRSLMLMVQRAQSQPQSQPGGNSAELEALRRKLRESEQAAAVKKYDSKFIFLEPRPEYVIDNINNGLYR
mgnify:CR=1 FL=1